MSISTEHILQCNQSEPLASVDLMNENGGGGVSHSSIFANHCISSSSTVQIKGTYLSLFYVADILIGDFFLQKGP